MALEVKGEITVDDKATAATAKIGARAAQAFAHGFKETAPKSLQQLTPSIARLRDRWFPGAQGERVGTRFARGIGMGIGRGFTALNESGPRVLGSALKFVTKSALSVLKVIPVLGAVAGGAAFGIYKLARSYANSTDALSDAIQVSGVAADAYQELRYATGLAGVTQEQFDTALRTFTANLGRARRGTGSLASAMKHVDRSLYRAVKAAPTTTAALELVYSALAKTTDPAKRAALASAAFGRGQTKMGLAAANGAVELAKARAEAHKLGQVLSTEDIAGASAMSDNLDRFDMAIGGLVKSIGGSLVPVLNPLVERMTAWVAVNREAIGSGIAEAVQWIADGIGGIDWDAWGSKIASVAKAFADIGETVKGVVDGVKEMSGPSPLERLQRHQKAAGGGAILDISAEPGMANADPVTERARLDESKRRMMAVARAQAGLSATYRPAVTGTITINIPNAPTGTVATIQDAKGPVALETKVGRSSLRGTP